MEETPNTDNSSPSGASNGSPVYPQVQAMKQEISTIKDEMHFLRQEVEYLRKDLEKLRDDLLGIGSSASNMATLMARQVEVQGMSYANLDDRVKKLEQLSNQSGE